MDGVVVEVEGAWMNEVIRKKEGRIGGERLEGECKGERKGRVILLRPRMLLKSFWSLLKSLSSIGSHFGPQRCHRQYKLEYKRKS